MSQLKEQKVPGDNKNSPVASVQRSVSSPQLSSPKSANFVFPVVPSVSETHLDQAGSRSNLETDLIEKSDTHISLSGNSTTSSRNESPVHSGSYAAFARTIGKRVDRDFPETEPNSPMSPVIKSHSPSNGPIEFQGLKYKAPENKKHSKAAQNIPGVVSDFSVYLGEIEEIEKGIKVTQETQLPEKSSKENTEAEAIVLKPSF